MKYFTSDIHFSDPETLLDEDRPFSSIKAFDKWIIKHWNKIAKTGDTIYVIGDLFDCHKSGKTNWLHALQLTKKVKADIILILGNNEERIIQFYFNNDFDKFRQFCLDNGIKDVKQNDLIMIEDTPFYLVHQPIHHHKEYINLYGHLHRSNGMWSSFGINVACDMNHFRLYSEQEIIRQVGLKNRYFPTDPNCNEH